MSEVPKEITELWQQARVAAFLAKKSLWVWLAEAIGEKLEKEVRK